MEAQRIRDADLLRAKAFSRPKIQQKGGELTELMGPD